jgi:protoporphyrin/coproporphyrin ferrochelatase
MLDAKPARCPVSHEPALDRPGEGRLAHAQPDHPAVARARTGVLLANLGTPDNYDYWSMRRYLNEFLSDKRVIDYPAWKWQPCCNW